jgi:mevalonyl-CoA ligase
MVLDRVKQILSHLSLDSPYSTSSSPYPGLSYHVGPHSPPLKHVTLAELLSEQVALNSDGEALVSAWQNIRWTYRELDEKSNALARSFYALGIRKGDRMAIMAGNCGEYVLVRALKEIAHVRLSLLRRKSAQY